MVAVSRLTTFGWPGRTVSEQPQYMTSLPFGGSDVYSVGDSSSTFSAQGFGCSGVWSLSVGASPRACRDALQRLLQVRVAAGVERDVHPASGRAGLRVAEFRLGVLAAAHQRAERGIHHALAHAPAHAESGEGGDVDPGLRDRRLDDLLRRGLCKGTRRRRNGGCDKHRLRPLVMARHLVSLDRACAIHPGANIVLWERRRKRIPRAPRWEASARLPMGWGGEVGLRVGPAVTRRSQRTVAVHLRGNR